MALCYHVEISDINVCLVCFISSSPPCFWDDVLHLKSETHVFVQHTCGSVFACACTEHTRICTILLSVFKWGPSCVISECLTICRRSLSSLAGTWTAWRWLIFSPLCLHRSNSLKSAVASVYTRALHSADKCGSQTPVTLSSQTIQVESCSFCCRAQNFHFLFIQSGSVVLDLVLFDVNIFLF